MGEIIFKVDQQATDLWLPFLLSRFSHHFFFCFSTLVMCNSAPGSYLWGSFGVPFLRSLLDLIFAWGFFCAHFPGRNIKKRKQCMELVCFNFISW